MNYKMYFKIFRRRRVCFVIGLSVARPQLLRMVSRVTRNHAGATASRAQVLESLARYQIAVQHSVHPTGGSLRVFKQFAWLEVVSVKLALSRPTHQRVTRAVGRRA
jgi:hypothetical protein